MRRPIEDQSEPPPRAPSRLAWLLPLVLVAVAYAEAPLGGFVWDDHALISGQESIQVLQVPHTYFERMFWSDSLQVSSSFYRPLVTLSYALDWTLWMGSPAGFHLTNLLLHLLVTALVYAFARRAGGSPWGAALASALFGLAPRLAESVAWISGRTDVMATLFALAAILAWPRSDGRWGRRVVAAVLLLCGLLSKEVAAAAALGIAVNAFVSARREGGWSRACLRLTPLAGGVAIYVLLRFNAVASDVRIQAAQTIGLPIDERWAAALASLTHYARMLHWPWRPETQIGRLGVHPFALVAAGFAVLAGLTWLLVRQVRRGPGQQLVATVTGLSALAMVLHVVPLALHVLAADRYLYLPLAMLLAGAVGPLEARLQTRRQRRLAVSAALALAISFIPATRIRVREWGDEQLLWTQAAKVAGEGDFYSQQQLGSLLMDARRWDDALVHLRQAEKAYGAQGSLTIWNNIALCLDGLGRRDEAIDLFEQMVRAHPDDLRSRMGLSMILLEAGRFDEAERERNELARRAPGSEKVERLRQLIASSKTRWESLSTPIADEPLDRTVARARYHGELGAAPEAIAQWARVLASPDVPDAIADEAVGYLVLEAPLPVATAALHRHLQRGADPARVGLYEAALAERSRL